jgi:MFS family permease
MGAGLRYVAMSPNLLRVLFRAALFGFSASAVPALMPLIARDVVQGGPLTYGILLGSFGIGAVGGALSSNWLRSHKSSEAITRIATVAMAVGAGATGASSILAITLVALLLAGAGWVLALSTFNVSVQMNSPRWVVARAVALYQMAAFGAMAVGSWLFGAIADVHGPVVSLHVAAALQLAGLIAAWLFPLQSFGDDNLDPHGLWREPDTELPIEPRSGPIVITLEHRVAQENVVRFLAAMQERRRIRLRDGARGWTLLRDLSDPQRWIERYHVPTWLEYIRHNQRRTHADALNSETLRLLRVDGADPVVHRMIERQTSIQSLFRTDPRALRDPMTDPTRSS